jgi:hypothetical protein
MSQLDFPAESLFPESKEIDMADIIAHFQCEINGDSGRNIGQD